MYSFKTYGRVIFDPDNITGKQKNQSSWKKICILEIDNGELASYYKWFIKKRFNLYLSNPVRGSHITIVNDSYRDFGDNITKWEEVKNKWENKIIEVEILVSPRTNGEEWWLKPTDKTVEDLMKIRNELGIGEPFYPLHLTIGNAVDIKNNNIDDGVQKAKMMNLQHSQYIHQLIQKGWILF